MKGFEEAQGKTKREKSYPARTMVMPTGIVFGSVLVLGRFIAIKSLLEKIKKFRV